MLLVSDRADWTDQAVELCRELGAVAESYEWSRAGKLKGRASALVADVGSPFSERLPLLGRWASQALQPLSVLSVVPEPGAGEFFAQVQELGYRRLIPANGLPSYWRCIRSNVRGILAGGGAIVPIIAERYRCYAAEAVTGLTIVVENAREVQTVEGLSRAMGLPNTKRLRTAFRMYGLPPAKETLERIRLALAIDYVAKADPKPTREQVARHLNYSSADYLGRHAKRLTGRSFGRLVGAGPSAAFLPLT